MHESSNAAPLRILVVDDNRDAAVSLSTLLQLKGHRTGTAHDGLEAVRAASREPYDVVLLDLGMPVMDGFEAAAVLKQFRSAPILVACSAWDDPRTRARTAEIGFAAHLTKPVPLDALDALLEATRRTRSRHRAGDCASRPHGSAGGEVQQVPHPHELRQ
jgi:CheY-like chemotaxis protein